MARRADHTREQLRKLILDISSKIIAGEGFSDLTARRIARDIGYTPGTIYNVFASMDDIYLAVNAGTLERLYDVLDGSACHNESLSPLENLKAMAGIYEAFAREHRNHWLLLFNSPLPQDRQGRDWYAEKISRLFNPLERLLTPLFPPDAAKREIETAARALFSAVHGVCFLQETGRLPLISHQDPQARMTDYMIDTFVRGLLRPPEHKDNL